MLILRWLLSVALRGKELVSLAMILVFCLWLSSLPETARKTWRVGMAGTILFPVQASLDQIRFRVGLKNEVAVLQKQNATLQAENVRLSQLALEARHMDGFEPLKPTFPSRVVSARVVSRNPIRLGGVWQIDVGSESGLQEGMAAMTPRGVVGRILGVYPGRAELQSLVDPECRIAVLSSRSRHPGIVYSPDGSQTLLEFSVTSDIKVGDSLVSWGAGGIFPKGLPVGKVVEILKTPANVLRTARIILAQDPWSAEDVAILVRPPVLQVGGGLPSEFPDSVMLGDSAKAGTTP